MDKELLEKILKGGITVQGDFVMEKQIGRASCRERVCHRV